MNINQCAYLAPDNGTYYEVLSKDYCVVMHFDEDWEGRLKHGGNINDQMVDQFRKDLTFKNVIAASGAVTPGTRKI
jgi:hypothetical protein